MLLNIYEVIYILKPDLTEEKNLQLVQKYKDIIKSNGGGNIFVQHRGRRHLSYNICHYYDGIYVQLNFAGNGHLLSLLEKSMKFNECIVRYFTLKKNVVMLS